MAHEIKTRTVIVVTTEFKSFHKYTDAPKQVAFLRNIHRHKFFVKAKFEVTHDNRDLEFFIIQSKLEGYIGSVLLPKLNDSQHQMSCEMMARLLIECFVQEGLPVTFMSIFEDNENGAEIEVTGVTHE